MPFVVYQPFSKCSEIHDAHSTLTDAASCFAEWTQKYGGEIPVDPISQKYVYAIAAIDRKGNQRNFSSREKEQAEELKLDPKSLDPEVPGITTFNRVARMYYAAAALIPISGISLQGLLDYKNKNQHFWATDAGIGQALAYAQQAAFTLELSLKAFLEALGRLAEENGKSPPSWQVHNLVPLFKLLTDDEQRRLEEWWKQSDAKRNHFHGTLRKFLDSSNKLYMKWRYITDLKSTDLSIDIRMLLSASEFFLSASDISLRERSPFKVEITESTYRDSVDDSGEPPPRITSAFVQGRVRSVKIPEGFDPHSMVEVGIDSDHHQHKVTALFFKRNVTSYHGLEGQRVSLTGYVIENEPNLLKNPQHIDPFPDEPDYTFQHLTLRGTVYDLKPCHPAIGGPPKIDLVLSDKTFFAEVECFFLIEEERGRLTDIKLGDELLIRGHVTLLNGKPMILVRPDLVERVS